MLSLNNEKLSKTTGNRRSLEESYFDVIGIAVALGGFKGLSEVISELPADFPVPILVVQHMSPDFDSNMAEILKPVTSLLVKQMENGERLERGTIYTAVPNKHMLVNNDGTISLAPVDKTEFTRPAADVTFVTLAISYKERAIGVLLTDAGQDGALGAMAIKASGGKVIAQEKAGTSGAPDADLRLEDVDYIMPLAEIAPLLINLAKKGKPD
ncbi:MAG: chemotaxis protein CheB [Methanotrichaceae archaeon]